MNKKSLKNRITFLPLATTIALLSAGCGKQAYNQTLLTEQPASPGHFEIPARVDILFAQDDSGSISTSYSSISGQMQNFLSGIEARGWDYHFAVTPLTRSRAINQVAASRFDANWGALWQMPFPGATSDMPGLMVAPAAFRTSTSVPGFTQFGGFISSTNGGAAANEPGLASISSALNGASATTTGFLRDDALLVVFIMSNGDDTSGFTPGAYPCSNIYSPECSTAKENSFISLRNQIANVKPNLNQVRVYSAVATQTSAYGGQPCLNGNAFKGVRYARMAEELGGQAFDICNQPISDAIESFAQHLQNERLSYRTRYVFISNEPNLSREIHVYKTSNGVEAEIPYVGESPDNGWSYEGYTSVYAIDSPIQMQLTTGYAIKLNGTSALIGEDSARVEYFIAGGADSISE